MNINQSLQRKWVPNKKKGPHPLPSPCPYPSWWQHTVYSISHTHAHTDTHLDTQIRVCGCAYTMPFDCRKVPVYSAPVCIKQCDQVYYRLKEISISHTSQRVLHWQMVSCFFKKTPVTQECDFTCSIVKNVLHKAGSSHFVYQMCGCAYHPLTSVSQRCTDPCPLDWQHRVWTDRSWQVWVRPPILRSPQDRPLIGRPSMVSLDRRHED